MKIKPHVLPTQTAWQRRRKDNISTLPGCAAELQTVIQRHSAGRKISSRVQNTTRAGNLPPVHAITRSGRFPPAKPAPIKPCSDAMQVANQGEHFLIALHYFTALLASGPRRSGRTQKQQPRGDVKSRLRVQKITLPALMSRSSWFACPSCCEVAMFSPSLQTHIDSSLNCMGRY